jgi:NitT/TauT family transport system substrate-binding protein
MQEKMTRRSALALTAGALLAPSLARAATASAITVAGVPEDSITPVLWAQQSGIFKRNGLDVTVQPQNSGSAIASGVAGGSYQIGKSSLTSLIAAHGRGVPLMLVAPAGLWDTNNPTIEMIVRTDSKIQKPADLNGKTIAVSSLSDLYAVSIKAWVDQNGGDAGSLKLVEMPISAVPPAIEQGRVDASALTFPQLQEALDSKKVRVIGKPYDAVAKQFLYAAWFTTKDYAQKNPEVISAFARSVREASTYANGHHADTVPLLAKFTGIPPAELSAARRATYGTTLDPKLIQPVIDTCAKYKLIRTAFEAREFISPIVAALR